MAISFEEARAIVAAAQGWDPAPWGWENDEVFVMAYDHGDDPGGQPTPDGEPDVLVDKDTGRLRLVTESPPAPNLRPVGDPPSRAET